MEQIRISTVLFIAFLFLGHKAILGDENYPNIVILYADDMGYGDAKCYNANSLIPTPNIDELASGGILFKNAHSSSAVCTPSRYSLLTGRYCWRTTLKKHVLWPWNKPLIHKSRLTLPEMLKIKGYQTAAIGKWHLGWNWPTTDLLPAVTSNGSNVDYSRTIGGGPLEHGFDYYYGDDVPNFPPYTFIENNKVTAVPKIPKPDSLFGDKGMMVEGWKLDAVLPAITKKAIEYINTNGKNEQPFFLYFALTAPHTPIAPLEKFKGKSEAGVYGDYVYEVDWIVGQIMQALEQNGISNNTLVVFTSDNGSPAKDGSYGEIGSVKKYRHSPNGNLRGYKGDIWEGGHRIPFIIRWPEKVKPKTLNSSLICQVDLMRTIAEILGYDLPDDAAEDSYNLLPVFFQENNNSVRKELVHHSWDGSFAITKGKWKYVTTNGSGGFKNVNADAKIVKGQLFNLENDIEEQYNLYEQYPELIKELKARLGAIILSGRSTPGQNQRNDSIDVEWSQIYFLNHN